MLKSPMTVYIPLLGNFRGRLSKKAARSAYMEWKYAGTSRHRVETTIHLNGMSNSRVWCRSANPGVALLNSSATPLLRWLKSLFVRTPVQCEGHLWLKSTCLSQGHDRDAIEMCCGGGSLETLSLVVQERWNVVLYIRQKCGQYQ